MSPKHLCCLAFRAVNALYTNVTFRLMSQSFSFSKTMRLQRLHSLEIRRTIPWTIRIQVVVSGDRVAVITVMMIIMVVTTKTMAAIIAPVILRV